VSVNTGIYYITTRYETPPRRFYFVYRSSFGRSNLVGHIILWPLLNFILISYDRYIIIIIYLHTLYLTLFVSLFPDYIVSAIPVGWVPSLLAIASVTHTPISLKFKSSTITIDCNLNFVETIMIVRLITTVLNLQYCTSQRAS